jgi:hypothetical protein
VALEWKPLLVAGALPAVLLGVATFLMKLAMKSGANVPSYLACVGATVCAAGLAAMSLHGG